MKEKQKEKIELVLEIGFLITSVFALIFSTYLFMAGFHNADSGQNMRYLECKFNVTFMDLATDGNWYSAEESYIMGENQREVAFLIGLVSAFMFGYFLQIFINKMEERI